MGYQLHITRADDWTESLYFPAKAYEANGSSLLPLPPHTLSMS